MLIDSQIQLLPFFAQTGADIAPVAPLFYRSVLVPGERPSSLFIETSGSADPSHVLYPGVLFAPGANGTATPRPILPNTGNLALLLDLYVDERTQAAANVIETDILIVKGGFKYNLSGQRHVSNGQIDIGNWTDTGIRAGQLSPNAKHKVKWSYSFDTGKHACSVLSYACDGQVYAVPAMFQNMPADPSTWEEGVYLQFQLGSLPAGDPWAIRVRADLEWL